MFDPAITSGCEHAAITSSICSMPSSRLVYLSLNQGTTTVREEFGARAREILKDRADLMRKRVGGFSRSAAESTAIDAQVHGRLPGDYVAGHASGIRYALEALPDEMALRADLQTVVRSLSRADLSRRHRCRYRERRPISMRNLVFRNQRQLRRDPQICLPSQSRTQPHGGADQKAKKFHGSAVSGL